MERKYILTLIGAFLMATYTLGFIVSTGVTLQKNVSLNGECNATFVAYKKTRILAYTYEELNGQRSGPYVIMPYSEETVDYLKQNNILFWLDADVVVDNIPGTGFVLEGKRAGDTFTADCRVNVINGRVNEFFVIEKIV